ncbi:MAG TPA: serine hydrolase domain-containing protein, partial [Iamia sp.]|nr:serine hydrolase domain-containing protein [Iamia sp.]
MTIWAASLDDGPPVAVSAGRGLDAGTGVLRPLAPADRVDWYCCSKVAMVIGLARLVEEGRVGWEDTVGSHVSVDDPALASATVSDLLTHRVAFTDDPPAGMVLSRSWGDVARCAVSARVRPSWRVGREAAYSYWVSWAVLGCITEAITGAAPAEWIAETVFAPLGLDAAALVPRRDREAEIDSVAARGSTWERIAQTGGGDERVLPGFSGRGTVGDLGALYQELAAGRSGRGRLLSTETCAEVLAVARRGVLDEEFGAALDWGRGLCVDPRFLGRPVGAEVVGHKGYETAMAVADLNAGWTGAIWFSDVAPATLAAAREDYAVGAVAWAFGGPEPAPLEADRVGAAARRDLRLAETSDQPESEVTTLAFLGPEWQARTRDLAARLPLMTGASGYVAVECVGHPTIYAKLVDGQATHLQVGMRIEGWTERS